jgi:hypothetical protein
MLSGQADEDKQRAFIEDWREVTEFAGDNGCAVRGR